MRDGRVRHITAVAALATLAAACESDGDAATTSIVTTTTSTTTTIPITLPPPTVAPTTTVVPEHVQSCVDYTQFQAFLGDPFWAQLWDDAERNEDRLRAQCTALGSSDPDGLAGIDAAWAEARAAIPTTTRVFFENP